MLTALAPQGEVSRHMSTVKASDRSDPSSRISAQRRLQRCSTECYTCIAVGALLGRRHGRKNVSETTATSRRKIVAGSASEITRIATPVLSPKHLYTCSRRAPHTLYAECRCFLLWLHSVRPANHLPSVLVSSGALSHYILALDKLSLQSQSMFVIHFDQERTQTFVKTLFCFLWEKALR